MDTSSLEEDNARILEEMDQVEEKLNFLLNRNMQTAIPAESYDELSDRYAALDERLGKNKEAIADKKTRRWRAEESLKFIQENNVIKEYSEERFRLLVESITVQGSKKLRFKFWDGSEISVSA